MGDEPFTERTPRIVNAAKLHRAAARRKAGRFLAEGANAVMSALRHGTVVDVFLTEAALDSFGRDLDAVTGEDDRGVHVSLITDRAAHALSESVTSTGLFALCASQLTDLGGVLAAAGDDTPCVLAVPVETAEPGNAGALIRVADATGAAGVVFAGETVDPQGGKAVRSSAGSLFHLPVTRHTSIPEVVEELHDRGFVVLATAGDGDVSLDEASVSSAGETPLLGQRVAWLFGNEAHGLGDWQDLADLRVSIPMQGLAESFNLVTAAAVCLYETARVARV
ncbi:RNA methyltransferase [uncultured Corynebacterium sp.]|uniref:TrmH family RNA methyltransferase n=1 Tax=uncultured Corynebacterium sp. TaxID=159447 RepID=UPI0025E6A9D7|nr:RNA methyltransferase [uncultured Corynebacterium sp.]